MTRALVGAVAAALLCCSSAGAQSAATKQATGVRVAAGLIHLDGRLDEAVWGTAPVVGDLIQRNPVEGAAPSDTTEIRFLFDDRYLYVGARMNSRHGAGIQAPMNHRDDGGRTDLLLVDLDTYHDRRTSYTFGVTAAGVRVDRYHPTDDESGDSDFDPVWEAATSVGPDVWTAEFRIPFAQLRFNDVDEPIWGLNITRLIPALEEEDYWVLVPRTERGWASRFGELKGLQGVSPRYRMELLPYAGSSTRFTAAEAGNPFDDGSRTAERAGMDAKLGVGPNLTLEATINPDFGQVEADPAEVNLSAFETFFSERRPFFLEGRGLIAAQDNFFYSRRIGARPSAPAVGDFVDYPDTTTILGAAKLTGRLKSGTSLGVIAAATDHEFARIDSAGVFGRVKVTPRAEYVAGRVQQEFGTQGSTLGFGITELHREFDAADPLSALLVRNAFTASGDANVRFADRTYEASLAGGVSMLDGSPEAIAVRQRSNVRYFQRPDGPPDRYDPTRTSLNGARLQGSLEKIAGRHWLWSTRLNADSPEFETNDLGQLRDAGDIGYGGSIEYRETEPGRIFRSYSFNQRVDSQSDFDRTLGTLTNIGTNAVLTWRNYWTTVVSFEGAGRGLDQRLTRGGPAMATPRGWNIAASTENSAAAPHHWNLFGVNSSDEFGGHYREFEGDISIRAMPQLQFSVAATYNQQLDPRQYVATLPGGRAETYGSRYVFGTIDRSTVFARVRAAYTFKPDLNLDVYFEPFAANGRYTSFGELRSPRTFDLIQYGSEGTSIAPVAGGGVRVTDGDATFTLDEQDFDVRSFRSNVVLRWEWRPGSTFFLIWQQDRSDSLSTFPPVTHVTGGDLFNAFTAPGTNILAVKMTVWLSR